MGQPHRVRNAKKRAKKEEAAAAVAAGEPLVRQDEPAGDDAENTAGVSSGPTEPPSKKRKSKQKPREMAFRIRGEESHQERAERIEQERLGAEQEATRLEEQADAARLAETVRAAAEEAARKKYLPVDEIDDGCLVVRHRVLQQLQTYSDVTTITRYSQSQSTDAQPAIVIKAMRVANKFISIQQARPFVDYWPHIVMSLPPWLRPCPAPSTRGDPVSQIIMHGTAGGGGGFKSTDDPMSCTSFTKRFIPRFDIPGAHSLLVYRGIEGGPINVEHLRRLVCSQKHRKFSICFYLDKYGGYSRIYSLEELVGTDDMDSLAPDVRYVRRRWATLCLYRAFNPNTDGSLEEFFEYRSNWAGDYRTQQTVGRNSTRNLDSVDADTTVMEEAGNESDATIQLDEEDIEDFSVGTIGPHHRLIINKFCVVRPQFVLHTIEVQSQNDPLSESDLSAAWNVLERLGAKYMAIFNCGADAGASLNHKHLQIIARSPGIGLESLLNEGETIDAVPFRLAFDRISQDQDGKQLHDVYLNVLRRLEPDLESAAHNVILTSEYMIVIPRRKAPLEQQRLGYVANAAAMMGLTWCPSEEAFEAWGDMGPMQVLEGFGVSKWS